jgi:hypothetical protein
MCTTSTTCGRAACGRAAYAHARAHSIHSTLALTSSTPAHSALAHYAHSTPALAAMAP